MKHVPSLVSGPQALAAYLQSNPIPQNPALDPTKIWKKFRNDAAYQDVRDALIIRQQGLCGYCERKLTNDDGSYVADDIQIEHVNPKSATPALTLDWRNLMACCCGGTLREDDPKYFDPEKHYNLKSNVTCGQSKGDLPLNSGCDPRSFPCIPRLFDIWPDGEMTVREAECRSVNIPPANLRTVIDKVLNLNCDRLKRARKKTIDSLLVLYVPVLDELLRSTHLTHAQVHQLQELWVAGRLQPDRFGFLRKFWTTERQYLDASAEVWIANHGHMVHCANAPTATAPTSVVGTP